MTHTRLKPTVRAAMQIALKTGVLTRCPHHWVYLRNTDDAALEHAFRLGNFLISHFAKSVACFKGDRRKLADAILRCREDADTTCPLCG
ncbi:MAG: hypothetical protein U0796_07440 [Gemmatales bacterium]